MLRRRHVRRPAPRERGGRRTIANQTIADDVATSPDGRHWQVGARRPLRWLRGYSVVIVTRTNDAAAVVLVRDAPGGPARVIDRWVDEFGGLGVSLDLLDECRADGGEHLVVRVVETNRGYWLDRGQDRCPKDAEDLDERCHVPPAEQMRDVVLGVDRSHAWIVADRDEPAPACAQR